MKSISTYVVAFLIIGFFFLALPEKGFSGPGMPIGCCQFELSCENLLEGDQGACSNSGGEVELGETCNTDTGSCFGVEPISANVPTLSEWGLIAMAGILGIVGYMVIRRRKVTA